MQFRKMKGYMPRIVVVHIPPQWRKEIKQELADVGRDIGVDIEVGYDEMLISLQA